MRNGNGLLCYGSSPKQKVQQKLVQYSCGVMQGLYLMLTKTYCCVHPSCSAFCDPSLCTSVGCIWHSGSAGFTFCVIYQSCVSKWKMSVHLLIYSLLAYFFSLMVTEGFIEEAEETIYFRVSPNEAFPPNCSQIDPDHLFENRLHTAEECITCPWTAAYFVLCLHFSKVKKKKKKGFFLVQIKIFSAFDWWN